MSHQHFKDKEAIGHVAEAQARGILESAEIHGTEIPGHLHAGADALRETALLLLALWLLLSHLGYSSLAICPILLLFSLGWMLWKTGRSAWLGWSRLERMHRIVAQERWEIQHHRPQEREELKELYRSKGLQGKLLDDVINVLMSDEERLLKIMVEEELGLSLETQEHPLKQGLGAALGVLTAAGIVLSFNFLISPIYGIWIGSLIAVSIGAFISAYYTQNEIVPAIIWNLGLGVLFCGSIYFLLPYFVNIY